MGASAALCSLGIAIARLIESLSTCTQNARSPRTRCDVPHPPGTRAFQNPTFQNPNCVFGTITKSLRSFSSCRSLPAASRERHAPQWRAGVLFPREAPLSYTHLRSR